MSVPTSIKLTVPLFLSFSLLAACGGGGGGFSGDTAGTTTSSTTTTTTSSNTGSGTVSSLRLTASSRQLLSDGSQPITISALAKDSSNNLLEDAGISFSVNNEADLPAATGATYVTAALTPGVPKNRQLTVTATAGSVSESILVDVIGTTASLSGPNRIAINSPTDYTLKMADSGNAELGFQAISLPTVSSGNCIVSTNETMVNGEFQTDAKGEFSYQVTGSAGGTCEIAVSALGATDQQTIEVSGDVFTIAATTVASADNKVEVDLGVAETVTLELSENGIAKSGETITLSSTRGTLSHSSVQTDGSGQVDFTISSGRAGSAVITATTSDGLTAVIDNIEFVATTPAYLTTQANPTLINALGTSSIISQIRDANDNPVKNQTINFSLNDVVNGVLSSSEAVTDSLGRASVIYTAGNATSEKDGVVITTSIQNMPTIPDEVTTLTVGGDALRIVLGSDSLLAANSVFYQKTFGVIVTDSSGNPIANQQVDFKINPINYYKGKMIPVDTDNDGEADQWAVGHLDPNSNTDVVGYAVECLNEDTDFDGQLDAGEDINNSGQLEPTNDAVVTTGTGTTGADGSMTVVVQYLKSSALWSKQRLTASTNVEGSEFGEQTEFILPVLADDVSDINQPAPNAVSSYGQDTSCNTNN